MPPITPEQPEGTAPIPPPITPVAPPPPTALPQPPPPSVSTSSELLFVTEPRSKLRVVSHAYDHDQARWGLGDMLASLVVFFVGSFALILLIFATVQSGNVGAPQGPWLVVVAVGPHLLLLAHLFWVSRTKGLGFAPDFQLRFRWSDLGLGFGLFLGAIFASGTVAAVIAELIGEPLTASAVDLARESSDGRLTIWLVVFAVLGATLVPLVEELVYRGLFWSALEKRGMRPWTVLFVTTAVFALIHMEPVRTAVLFVVGMVIGVGRLVTGRIGASIVAHMFINALAMTATLVEIA